MFDKIISGIGRIIRGIFGFREEMLRKREERTGMRQSFGAMIAKLCVGGIFFAMTVSFYNDYYDYGTILFALSFSLAFFAWGLVPFITGRRRKKIRDAEIARLQHISEMERIMNMPLDTFSDQRLRTSMQKLDGTYIDPDDTPEEVELKKYREMLREGLITEADYERKKNMILGFTEAGEAADKALSQLETGTQQDRATPPM